MNQTKRSPPRPAVAMPPTHTLALTIPPLLSVPLLSLYGLVLAVIMLYGLHRFYLLHLFRANGRALWTGDSRTDLASDRAHWPRITVQLPMFNEKNVAARAIEAAGSLDYPRDRFEVQVLDDSTDDSAVVTRQAVEQRAAQGCPVSFIHRDSRDGYKAGALAAGLEKASGELIAIFDADFVPPIDFLKRCVHHFDDPRVGMVQTRWIHLNRERSALTRSQAVLLDGHFVIEHTARASSNRWFNFNGTAGLWRRTCIEDAGGWSGDTLTEDVDLSYRAQLRGWRFVYDPAVQCPAELPPNVTAFKTQQHRWTKGSLQTGFKLLPAIWKSDADFPKKTEATFHLTAPAVSLFVVILTLLIFPSFLVPMDLVEPGTFRAGLFGLTLIAVATGSAGVYYVASQTAQRRGFWSSLAFLPVVLAVGIGISVNNARAVIEAILGRRSAFIRTPKLGDGPVAFNTAKHGRWRLARGLVETTLGVLMIACIAWSIVNRQGLVSVPFLALFAVGYLAVGLGTMRDNWRGLA